MKYLWAAYRTGCLSTLDPKFEESWNKNEFAAVLERVLMDAGLMAWTIIAETKTGIQPIGLATGWWLGRSLLMARGVVFPWATDRNVREGAFYFFDSMRKVVIDEERDIPDPLRYLVVLQPAHFEHKKFYESLENHGILRKVGHVLDLEEKPSVLFQTRSPVV